jgi:hypothetical protein
MIPDQGGIEEQESPPRTNETEADDPNTMATVVVERFPGSPGIPIPGVPRGTSARESERDTSRESMWAPFRSQKDWEFAHWVKTDGSSSSAVDNLLAIPNVCPFFFSDYCL